MTFRATGDRTEVTYRADFTFEGFARFAGPFLKRQFSKLGDDAETGLRTTLRRLQG